MRGSVRRVVALLLCFGCDSDYFPEGLFDYQVERLLSAGDSLVWNQVIDSENCRDSVKLLFEFLSDSRDDSVSVFQLLANDECNGFKIEVLGNADASSFDDELLFTDSLNFADGRTWIIRSITANELKINTPEPLRYVTN